MLINYAHRGASAYAPENTFAAFYLAVEMGANGIETDVRRTRDGVLVLFHDNKLTRITGYEGSISDYTYNELLDIDFGSYKGGKYKNERIVTLEDMLKYFSGKDLKFDIELKDKCIEKDTLNAIYKFQCWEKTSIISFDLESLENVRYMDSKINIGYLTNEIKEDTLNLLDNLKIKHICPKAEHIDSEKVTYLKNKGFSVRCWGINNMDLMYIVMEYGVDGMTIDFPDKLAEAIRASKNQFKI